MDKKEAIRYINDVFNSLHIQYALIGAYAVAVWGIPRATKDIDFIADISAKETEPILKSFQSCGFKTELHPADTSDPLGGLIKLIYADKNETETIDVVLGIKKLPEETYKRTVKLSFYNSDIPIISPEDLVIAKFLAGSPLDIQDAKNIISVMKDKIDMVYINNFCKKYKIKLPL